MSRERSDITNLYHESVCCISWGGQCQAGEGQHNRAFVLATTPPLSGRAHPLRLGCGLFILWLGKAVRNVFTTTASRAVEGPQLFKSLQSQ